MVSKVKHIQNILAKKEEQESNEIYPNQPSARTFDNSKSMVNLQYRNQKLLSLLTYRNLKLVFNYFK